MKNTLSLTMIAALIVMAVACEFFKPKETAISKVDSTAIDSTKILLQDTVTGVVQNDSVSVSK